MENLPTETFLHVTTFLPTSDKLNCIRVCRKWYEIMTENNLYATLVFKEQNKLLNALDLFRRCPDMRRTVTKLVFTGPEVEVEDIVWLPHLFPNVKSFTNHREKLLKSYSAQYRSAFEAWSHLEYLEDASRDLYIANTILQSGLYNHLKSLEVNFHNLKPDISDGSITSNPAFKTLLRNLQHAPRLEVFSARHGFIDLSDMELLHTNAPNLRELNLTNVEFENLTVEERVLSQTITPANKLRKLRFHETSSGFTSDDDLSSTTAWRYMANWFAYFSRKYTFLEDILIEPFRWDDGLIMPDMIVQPLKHLVSCLPKLKAYGMKTYPITLDILQAWDDNDLELEKLSVWMWTMEEVEDQLDLLQVTGQSMFIKKLVVNNPEAMEWPGDLAFDPPNLCNLLFQVCNDMPQLVDLTIDTGGKYSRILFQSIFENVPQLETLSFRTIRVGYSDDHEDYSGAPTPCELKHLDFKVSQFTDGQPQKDKKLIRDINSSIKFAIDSCPQLETFKMGGALRKVESGEILLDFTNNRRLKRIDMNFFDFDFCVCHKVHPGTKSKKKKNARVVHVLCNKSVDLELEKRDYMDFDVY